jgi:hypothetical protein
VSSASLWKIIITEKVNAVSLLLRATAFTFQAVPELVEGTENTVMPVISTGSMTAATGGW